jgi:DegV family protein with EDD domain
MNIQIITDSTSDIPEETLENLPITVLPLYITLNGQSYQDNIDLTRESFYESLPNSDPHPTTAAPSPEQFIQAYEAAADDGADVIFSIHISKSLSATFDSVEAAAREFTRIPVYAIDSGNLTMAEGLIVIKAAEAAKAGKTPDEILNMIKLIIPRTYAYAKLDTIDYLLRGGRMSSIQHSVVSLLGIKPILKMNNSTSKMEIARTKSTAFERVLKTAVENIPHAEAFGITHANVPDQVEALISRLKEVIPALPEPLVSGVTPALGAHVGPGSLCVNWIESVGYAETKKTGLKKWFT